MNNTNRIPLDTSQKAFCELEGDAIRLLAPAGSGKTHSLLWRCRRLVHDTPDARIILFTFTRAARDELVARLTRPEFAMIQSNITITTLNSYGFMIIRHAFSNPTLMTAKPDRFRCVTNTLQPIWKTQPKLEKLLTHKTNSHKAAETLLSLSDHLKSLGFRHDLHDTFDSVSRHLAMLASIGMGSILQTIFNELAELDFIEFNDINDLSMLWKSSGKRPYSSRILEIEHRIYDNYFAFWRVSTKFLLNCEMLTLEDQKYAARIMLDKQLKSEHLHENSSRFHHIFVDEFQDINPLDLALLKTLAALNQTQLTLVGDDDQAIYEWRGATPAFILAPQKFLGVPYQTRILSTNYRSPANIVALSQKLIEHNQHRLPKIMHAASEQNARIEILQHPTVSASIKKNFDLIMPLLERGNRVALISRKKSQLIPYQIMFASQEIPFCAAEDLQIFLSSAFRELQKIVSICAQADQPKDFNFDPRESLLTLCDKIKRYPLSNSDRAALNQYLLQRQPQTIREACAFLNEYTGPLKGKNDSGRKSEQFVKAIRDLFNAKSVSDVLETISLKFEGLQKDYGKSDDDIYYSDPPFLYLSELAQQYGRDFQRFYADIEKTISTLASFNEAADADNATIPWNRQLHLMTALRAKGKEFDAVFILDANKNVWPSKLAVTEPELEQERRLFYVAMTRAKKYLYFSVDNKFLNTPASPSPYLQEIGLL